MKLSFMILLLSIGSIPTFADSLQQRVVDLQLERVDLLCVGHDENTPSIEEVNADLDVLLKEPDAENADYYDILKKKLPLLKAGLVKIEAEGYDPNHPRCVAIRNEIDFIKTQLATQNEA